MNDKLMELTLRHIKSDGAINVALFAAHKLAIENMNREDYLIWEEIEKQARAELAELRAEIQRLREQLREAREMQDERT